MNRMMKATLLIASIVSSMAAPRLAHSQDTNYWNLSYGTRGELVSGVMVGSALDLSSSFYNPGAFVRMENPSVLLTGTVFAMQRVTLVSGDPASKSPQASSTGPAPSMVAGLLPMKWFGGRMGYSFLTRQQFDFRFTTRSGVVAALDQPGDTLSIGGELVLEQNMGEYWGGLTWSRDITDDVSFGTTVYGVYRSQRSRLQGLIQAFGNAGYASSATNLQEVDYWTGRALAKFGLLGEFGDFSAGVSFTTPGLHVLGTGQTVYLRSITGDVDFDGIPDGRAAVSYAESRDADFQSPASVAVGVSYRFDALTLHATSEYFAALDEYTVLESPAGTPSPGVTPASVTYRHAADTVWNNGVAVEYRFAGGNTAYGAFTTDLSSATRVSGTPVTASTWNIYHLSGGVALTLGGTELTLGGGFSWGRNAIERDIPTSGDLPPNVVPERVDYSRAKFIIGIAL